MTDQNSGRDRLEPSQETEQVGGRREEIQEMDTGQMSRGKEGMEEGGEGEGQVSVRAPICLIGK